MASLWAVISATGNLAHGARTRPVSEWPVNRPFHQMLEYDVLVEFGRPNSALARATGNDHLPVQTILGYRIKLWRLSSSYAQTFRSSKP